ncbi:hypothetical protein CCM_07538 [Cordyceps militaris CM01]|uniref:2EXR domain-containing protein n=1 Tax=Cordyceps militaris (strain CM01) TaxID=983644 RepID=G3JQ35_CORMM|nr:uncharacterized protein CCM_07538 [Cordyceps militaris CM01]EGX89286.1 hypothetical protein CCM_07538 [Cordyceps militaris CM01]
MFPRFQQLPPYIRHQIWREAALLECRSLCFVPPKDLAGYECTDVSESSVKEEDIDMDDGSWRDTPASTYDTPASTYDTPASTYDTPASRYDTPASRYNPAVLHGRPGPRPTASFEMSIYDTYMLREACPESSYVVKSLAESDGLPSWFDFDRDTVRIKHDDLRDMFHQHYHEEFNNIQHLIITFSKQQWESTEMDNFVQFVQTESSEDFPYTDILQALPRKLKNVTFEVAVTEGDEYVRGKPSTWMAMFSTWYRARLHMIDDRMRLRIVRRKTGPNGVWPAEVSFVNERFVDEETVAREAAQKRALMEQELGELFTALGELDLAEMLRLEPVSAAGRQVETHQEFNTGKLRASDSKYEGR